MRGDTSEVKGEREVEGPRPHSVKVPRLYKVASNILREYDEGKDSIKNLVFNCKKHPNTKALFALVMETANHSKQIDEATKKIQLFVTEPRFHKHLAFVLINELIWGKQELPGDSLPVQTVLKYKKRLKKSIDVNTSKDLRALDASWPRYARVNTLCNSQHRVSRALREEGWLEVMYDRSVTSSAEFLDLVSSLSHGQYLVDLHIPNLLVFPPKTPLYEHELVKDGSLVLQDKSSCFPVTALSPRPGSCVMDACAAPGMKTSQLAATVAGDWVAALGGQPPPGARVIAVERSSKRHGVLCDMLAKTRADTVTTALNSDFLELEPSDYPEVEYMVLDPSCSGTGMAKRGGDEEEPSQERLQKLSSLQYKLLAHALRFPGLKRVVYSTCAVSPEENEEVIAKVISSNPEWKVSEGILSSWTRRGIPTFPDGDKFVRADSELDWCNGFFVAVLERNSDFKVKGEKVNGEETHISLKKEKKKKKNKEKENLSLSESLENQDLQEEEVPAEQKIKKKKKKKEKMKDIDIAENTDEIQGAFTSKNKRKAAKSDEIPEPEAKKKKNKNKNKENLDVDEPSNHLSSPKKEKKKMKKDRGCDSEPSTELMQDIKPDQSDNKKKKKQKKKAAEV